MPWSWTRAILVAPILWAMAGPATATPAIDFTSVTATYVDAGNRNVGWEFTPSQALSVTRLGFYDAGGDGLAQAHDVGLYTGAGALVTSATVLSGTSSTLQGVFRWVDIAPVSLNAGQLYVVGTYLAGTGDAWVWSGSVVGVNIIDLTVAPFIQVGAAGTARYNCCSEVSLAYPATQIGGNRFVFVGANFDATAVPEPGSLTLLAAGLTCFLFRRRSA